ncbi:MAG: tetratricopeptide repeat protein, partial [Acidobacteria bacterium]|nr:tetratricopeptide repeat protein [Acidobacteriota bacterium]
MKPSVVLALVALTLALVAVAVFWGARDNEFVWDDPIVFQQQLPYFDSFSNVFFPPKGIPQFGQSYYRPLIIVTYQLDEKIAASFWPLEKREQARRIVYHTTPVLWHAAATVLVFLLGIVLTRLTGSGGPEPPGLPAGWAGLSGSAAAALLFAVHPIHTESVAWMAGRSDVVCAVFFLAAVLFYLLHRATLKLAWLLAAAAAALAAMMSKETGVGLLLLVPLIDRLTEPGAGLGGAEPIRSRAERRLEQRAATKSAKGGKRAGGGAGAAAPSVGPGWALRWGLFAAVGAFYFLVRNSALASSPNPFSTKGGGGPEALPAALGWYLQKLIWPPPQSAFVADMPGWPGILAGLVAGVGSAYLLWLWSRKPGWGREGIALGLFYAALAPSMAIALFSISETPLAERYLYIPSAGALLLFGFLLERAAGRLLPATKPALQQGLVAAVAVLVALPAAAATVKRAEVWQSDLAFWQDAVVKSPRQGIPHLHLGIAYATQGKTEAAVEEYKLALQYYDDREGRAKAHNNLGSAYLRLERYSEAIEHFKGALQQDPDYATPYYNWALASFYLAQAARREGRMDD